MLSPAPPQAAARPPTARAWHDGHRHLVLASDLDVVAVKHRHEPDGQAARTWRVLAVCANWRNGIESQVLASLDPGLSLAGLTAATLHGKAVLLLLCHRAGGPGGTDDPRLAAPGGSGPGQLTVYFDRWQSSADLGAAPAQPLLRVHMRAPDRPGATLEVLESLREALREVAPGAVRPDDWKVWYARAAVTHGNVAKIQLTIILPVGADISMAPVDTWGSAEFARIERRTLELVAHHRAARHPGTGQDPWLDTASDTVIRLGLVSTPDLS